MRLKHTQTEENLQMCESFRFFWQSKRNRLYRGKDYDPTLNENISFRTVNGYDKRYENYNLTM